LELLNYLNQNNVILTVIFSAIVALSTATYALLTWRLVSETKKMREVQTEPKISISIETRKEWISLIDLNIQNIGLGPAFDIKFKINNDFEYEKGESLLNLGFVKNGIPYLAPEQRINFFFTSMASNFNEKVNNSFEIEVTYKNNIGKLYNDKFLIDFSHLVGLSQISDPICKMSKNIESIEKAIKTFTTLFTREYAQEVVKRMIDLKNKNNTSSQKSKK